MTPYVDLKPRVDLGLGLTTPVKSVSVGFKPRAGLSLDFTQPTKNLSVLLSPRPQTTAWQVSDYDWSDTAFVGYVAGQAWKILKRTSQGYALWFTSQNTAFTDYASAWSARNSI